MADASPPSGDEAKAAAPAQKVELDLDDAPFLEDEPPPEEPKPVAETPPPAPEAPKDTGPKKLSLLERIKAKLPPKKKLLIIGGGAGVFLIGAIVGAFFLFSGPKAPPPPPPPAVVEPRRETLPSGPKLPDTPPPAQFLLSWDPFWVEQKDTEGSIRFLVCKFGVPTDSAPLYGEMQAKKVVLRDAIYYYLRNRTLTILDTEAKTAALKDELRTVINEHVASGKVEDIYIENYLIR